MDWLRQLRFRLVGFFRQRRLEADMAEEIRLHLERDIQSNIQAGMSPEEARNAARRQFGGVEQVKEYCRDERGLAGLEQLLRELRFAVRSLLKTPGFTLIAIITLGLGIGANTSMFSVVNTIMLDPLAYPDSEQLDRIYRTTPQEPEGGISPPDFLELQAEADGYGKTAAFAHGEMSLSEPDQPAEFARALRVSANFFSTLGIQPELGRDFRPGEAIHGNHRVLVISRHCWLNRFGGKDDIIGRTVRVDGEPHEIVGVLPETFNDWRHLGWVDFFRPLGLTQKEMADRTATILQVIGRRSSAISHANAEGFIARFGERLAVDFPAANAGSRWRTTPLDNMVRGFSSGIAFSMLIGLSGFVLLIACSNLANLFLARTMSRAREFAVRSALGASCSQVLRPLVAESLLLAGSGGACAVFVAIGTSRWLAHVTANDNGQSALFDLDWRVLSWAGAASLVTALAFGLTPALFALRLDINGTLKSGSRGAPGGYGHRRLRHFLIVGQFVLAMVLLAGAALFIGGLADLNHRHSGWESDHLVAGTILLPAAQYEEPEDIIAFQSLALERLAALPGVESASISRFMPFLTWYDTRKYVVPGREPPQPGQEPAARVNTASHDYFATVGTRLIAGRTFNEHDMLTSPKVFIINQAMAHGLFGDENPIGRRIAQAGGDAIEPVEIIGVVSDVKSILPEPAPVTFQVYQPITQEPLRYNEIAVRTDGVAPSTLVHRIRATVAELDGDLPMRDLKPADARIARASYRLGIVRDMLSVFAILGLGLAAMGIYGVIERIVAQRKGEFGIRIALGAQAGQISRMVLGSGVELSLAGSAIGLLGAFGISRLLAAGFPGVRFDSTIALAGAALVLIAVALVACYLPARRASKINPIETLCTE